MIVEQSEHIIREIQTAFMGKDEIIRRVLTTIYAGGHVLLEDSPGVGKTTHLNFFRVISVILHIHIAVSPLPAHFNPEFQVDLRVHQIFNFHPGSGSDTF